MKAIGISVLLLSALMLLAFQRNRKDEVKKMDARAKKSYYLVPDFYNVSSQESGDSLLTFECYDSSGKELWMADIHVFPKVHHIAYKRYYYDTAHLREDSLYGEIPTREDRLITDYFKLGTNGWLKRESGSTITDTLLEYRNEIVKRDTLRVYPGMLPGSLYNLFYIAYYKTRKK